MLQYIEQCFAAGMSKIPTLRRADDDGDAVSDSGTYNVDDDDSVAVVEARRNIDKAFGLPSSVSSVISVTNNVPVETQVTILTLTTYNLSFIAFPY